MTISRHGVVAASAIVAFVAITAGCGTAGEEVQTAGATASAGQGIAPEDGAPADGGVTGHARTEHEQEFLNDLTAFGLPTDKTADTTVEVGIGICRGITGGADTDAILDRIRPLTSAIAAHDAERDTAEVGRAIVDASRTHLCA